MKSLKPTPTRAGDGGAAPCPPGRRTRKTRALAASAVACVALALLAVVSSTSASRLASRASLGGSSSTDRPHLSSTEASRARLDGAGGRARKTSAGATGLDYAPKAAPLFAAFAPQLPPDEAVALFEEDCTTPRTPAAFNLGEKVCARATDVVVGGSEFFPIIPLRQFSWVNPAGFQVRSTPISSSTQTDTFTIPADATTTFGDLVADNRGGWRVIVTSIFDPNERASAGFTVRQPNNAAVDLSALTTQEQRQERVPAGSQAPFLISVENKGPDPAASVEVRFPVPDYTTFFSLIPPAGFTCLDPAVGAGPGGTSVCTAASLPPGAPVTFTAIYLISGEAPTDAEVTSTVTVTSATTERHQPDNASSASYLVASQPQCTITTPQDITVDNDLSGGQGLGGAVVTYGAPTTAGNCGTVTCDPPSGSFFPVGETFVTCSNAGQTVLERFRVVVNDTRTPTISCPANMTAETAPGEDTAAVEFPAPNVSDNDANVQVSFDPPSGSPLAIGTHTVTATATDASGNSASCTFTVTVNRRQGDCTITPDVANLPTITGECSAVASVIPTATDSCAGKVGAATNDPRSFDEPGTYTIHWTYTNAGGTTVTQDQTVVVTAGSGALTVTGAPNVNVPITAGSPSCAVEIDDLGAVLNTNVGGSCSGVDVTRSVSPPAPGNVFHAGTAYTVVTTVTDGASTASVTQTLRVIDGVAPTVTAPADAAFECAASVPAADPSQATAADNCGAPTVTVSETTNGGAGSAASPLVITRTYTATDSGGRTASDSQLITVSDGTAPAITAPADVAVNADPVSCGLAVALGSPTVTDNCATTVANNAPAVFPLGTTTVTWTATDAAGNTATATQRVTVSDVTAPVITLNGAGTIVVECHTSFADPGAGAADACDSNVPVNAAGSVNVNVPGVYTITYTASDDSGNAAAAVTRTVEVRDTTPPVIACPADITVFLPLNSPAVSMPVSFAVTSGDSCDAAPAVALSHAPGSVFPVGTTTVTATATDASGNTSSCSFNVTVLYNFTGFFSPVENPPTLNQVNAGRAIPVKFSLSGNKGLAIFAAGYPASQQVACSTSAPISDIEETVTAGNSSLSYEAGSDRYHYVWKTNSAWAGTCRQLVLKLNDGTSHTALFKFK